MTAYDPGGKVKLGVDALRAEPNRIFTTEDLAKIMHISRSAVPAYLDSAVRHGLIFRNTRHGALQYAGSRFAEEPAKANVGSPTTPAWVPPAMVAPRPGSEQPRRSLAPLPAPAPAAPDPDCADAATTGPAPIPFVPAPKLAEINHGLARRLTEAATGPKRPPAPAPTPAPTPEPPPAPQVPTLKAWLKTEDAQATLEEVAEEEEEEDTGPDAFISCRTGQIVLVGIEPDEDGRIYIPADLVQDIKRHLAWSPAR